MRRERCRIAFAYALLERGDLDEAERTLEKAGLGDDIPELVNVRPVLECRGRVRIERGDMAAEALLRLDRREEALALVDEEVKLAEVTGLPRAIGMALRVAGLARQEREPLERAVEALEQGETLTELARARIALGALLRRGGERQAAQVQLRLALDHADRAARRSQAWRRRCSGGSRPS